MYLWSFIYPSIYLLMIYFSFFKLSTLSPLSHSAERRQLCRLYIVLPQSTCTVTSLKPGQWDKLTPFSPVQLFFSYLLSSLVLLLFPLAHKAFFFLFCLVPLSLLSILCFSTFLTLSSYLSLYNILPFQLAHSPFVSLSAFLIKLKYNRSPKRNTPPGAFGLARCVCVFVNACVSVGGGWGGAGCWLVRVKDSWHNKACQGHTHKFQTRWVCKFCSWWDKNERERFKESVRGRKS